MMKPALVLNASVNFPTTSRHLGHDEPSPKAIHQTMKSGSSLARLEAEGCRYLLVTDNRHTYQASHCSRTEQLPSD
jgi:hypothetical protein